MTVEVAGEQLSLTTGQQAAEVGRLRGDPGQRHRPAGQDPGVAQPGQLTRPGGGGRRLGIFAIGDCGAMSLTRNAEATASRTADSRWLELLARAGFIGYGIVHLLFAWLALQIAFGKSGDDGDQSGALRTLAAQPLGKFLVIAIAVGLLAMAIWQALEAAVGHRAERGKERVMRTDRLGRPDRRLPLLRLDRLQGLQGRRIQQRRPAGGVDRQADDLQRWPLAGRPGRAGRSPRSASAW